MLHMILFSLLCLLAVVDGQRFGTTCSPTPLEFRDLFMRGCISLKKGYSRSECADYWGAFYRSFARINPNYISTITRNYKKYFDLFEWPENAQRNSFLFWSQTVELSGMLSCMCDAANVFAGPSYDPIAIIDKIIVSLIMENTLSEDGLRWCGTTANTGDGIQYTGNCNCAVSYAFFQEFSVRFAKAARGTIFYLGNGESENGAFNKTSFFAEHELPHLTQLQTPSAVILVVHYNTTVKQSGPARSESCGQGSLVTLRKLLLAEDIAYTCYDVFSDSPNTDSSLQLLELTNCAARIITSIQNGTEPADDDCFSKENSSREDVIKERLRFYSYFVPLFVIGVAAIVIICAYISKLCCKKRQQ